MARHHFLWNIGQRKAWVSCIFCWSCILYHYRRACAISDPDTDTLVVTGGFGYNIKRGGYARTTVSRYGKKGYIETFSSGLKTGRLGHGCTSFVSQKNERVKLYCLRLINITTIIIISGVPCHWRLYEFDNEKRVPCLYWGVSPLYWRVEGSPWWCVA